MVLQVWKSFRALPLWVQIWVAGILVPVNMASLAFVSQPKGGWIALLAIGAMVPNMAIILIERGFSKMMALPHLIPWGILVVWLMVATPQGSAAYGGYLWVLLGVDLVSLGFDIPDAIKWWRGDRATA